MRRRLPAAAFAVGLLLALSAWPGAAETIERFPPPDFVESGHELPESAKQAADPAIWQLVDVVLLVAALSAMTWLLLYRRSRNGVVALTVASLAYFGFIRGGCVCPIGAIQNVSLGLADANFVVPWGVILYFVLPLGFALVVGRVFCGGVCPLGAIQDVVLLKAVKVPRPLAAALGTFPFIYLGLAVLLAATDSAFVICEYDPFVPFFKLAGPLSMFILGLAFLILSTFVGRPYCRFVCPYGALLSVCSKVSMRKVTITPDDCIVCGLCEDACAFDCIRKPNAEKGELP